jgi:hypothetical protein
MTSGLQLAILGGLIAGGALAAILWRLAPTHPDLSDALDRLSPDYVERRARRIIEDAERDLDKTEKLGLWAMRVLPAKAWVGTPTRDLAVLRKPVARFYGEKITFALLGLIAGPIMAYVIGHIGFLHVGISFPIIGSLATAAGMFFLPNYNAIDDAKTYRVEFTKALVSYYELVATERLQGSGTSTALVRACSPELTNHWAFGRIRERLLRAELGTTTPWDALNDLAEELTVPELADLADICRLSGETGAQIYHHLRARASQLRSTTLSNEIAKANAVSERMYVPGGLLGVTFMLILIAPTLLRIIET